MSAGTEKNNATEQLDLQIDAKTQQVSDHGMKQVKAAMNSSRGGRKSAAAFRTISEVAEDLGVQQHVLRFWETKFSHVKPLKRGGGRRYYRPEDISLLKAIHNLLYVEGYTIKGVQKLLRDVGKNQIVLNFSDVKERGDDTVTTTQTKTAAVDDVEQNGAGKLSAKQRRGLESVLEELKELRGMIKNR